MFRQRHTRLVVDVIIPDLAGRVIVIARGHKPYLGAWCLPGGMVEVGETVEQAAVREVREEIGIAVAIDRVLGIRSAAARDPRGHYISIVVIAQPTDARPQTTAEARDIMRVHAGNTMRMAFDHAAVLNDYWTRGMAPAPALLA